MNFKSSVSEVAGVITPLCLRVESTLIRFCWLKSAPGSLCQTRKERFLIREFCLKLDQDFAVTPEVVLKIDSSVQT